MKFYQEFLLVIWSLWEEPSVQGVGGGGAGRGWGAWDIQEIRLKIPAKIP